jgi:hypothetical protein
MLVNRGWQVFGINSGQMLVMTHESGIIDPLLAAGSTWIRFLGTMKMHLAAAVSGEGIVSFFSLSCSLSYANTQ